MSDAFGSATMRALGSLCFSNLKSWLIGTHHGVSPQHLQAYLNEHVFRFNRRGKPKAAFQTVLSLADERLGPTCAGLYRVAKGKKIPGSDQRQGGQSRLPLRIAVLGSQPDRRLARNLQLDA